MKICHFRGQNVSRRWNSSLGRRALSFLVGIVSQHEAQQQPWHDNVAETQHRKVSRIVHTGKNELARQVQLRWFANNSAEIEFSCDETDGIFRWTCRDFHHHICAEDVGGEKDPEDVVDEQTSKEKS